jgi:hypothetical protein
MSSDKESEIPIWKFLTLQVDQNFPDLFSSLLQNEQVKSIQKIPIPSQGDFLSQLQTLLMQYYSFILKNQEHHPNCRIEGEEELLCLMKGIFTQIEQFNQSMITFSHIHVYQEHSSLIVKIFPAILDEFNKKHLNLLWRGTRHGFCAYQFHERCQGHHNTLLIILDTHDNVFGGFTPIEWPKSENCINLRDDQHQSFLFTIINSKRVEPTIFPLKEREGECAISHDPIYGPRFGYCDLVISEHCNIKDNYTTFLGECYRTTSELNGPECLTGSRTFLVKEIEIFEVFN